ncbi:MAG TPA: phosphomannomutase, partial [Stellaceae bacterium]|nr:phosphomannomutase [Stellaceae bacterium]
MHGGAGARHRFHPTILREYDIRGVVGETLSAADATAIGRCYAAILRQGGGRRVAVGRDGRLSSPELEAALVAGLTQSGIDVVRIGLGPTPMLYFAVNTLGVDGGLMVTGSHNPADYNGFKMMLGKKPFFGADIQRLGTIAAGGDFAAGEGKAEERAVRAAYVARLLADYAGTRPLRVAWDAGNGATGEVLRELTERLPGTHVRLNDTIDGRFPAHHPDPTEPKNLVQLQEA